MDCISHTRIAKLISSNVSQYHGINLDLKSFIFGNLKPDLKAEYLTKRHNPSVMFDDVMELIMTFSEKYAYDEIGSVNYSIDLGEICHYLTDFVSYPHNDDIYHKNLLSHYIYEKRAMITIVTLLSRKKTKKLTESMRQVFTPAELISAITHIHSDYKYNTKKHSIQNDFKFIINICLTFVVSMNDLLYAKKQQATA